MTERPADDRREIRLGPVAIKVDPFGGRMEAEPHLSARQLALITFGSLVTAVNGEVRRALSGVIGSEWVQQLMALAGMICQGQSVTRVGLVLEGSQGVESYRAGPDIPNQEQVGRALVEQGCRQLRGAAEHYRDELALSLPARRELERLPEEIEVLSHIRDRIRVQELILARRERGRLADMLHELGEAPGEGKIDLAALSPDQMEELLSLGERLRGLEERQQELGREIVRLTRQAGRLEEQRGKELMLITTLSPTKLAQLAELREKLQRRVEEVKRRWKELSELEQGEDETSLHQIRQLMVRFPGFEVSEFERAKEALEELELAEEELAETERKLAELDDLAPDLATLGEYRAYGFGFLLLGIGVAAAGIWLFPNLTIFLVGGGVLAMLSGAALVALGGILEYRWKEERLGDPGVAREELIRRREMLFQRIEELTDELGFIFKVGGAEEFRTARTAAERLVELISHHRPYWEAHHRLREARRELALIDEQVTRTLEELLPEEKGEGGGAQIAELSARLAELEQVEERLGRLRQRMEMLEEELAYLQGEIGRHTARMEAMVGKSLRPGEWRRIEAQIRRELAEPGEGQRDQLRMQVTDLEARYPRLSEELKELSQRLGVELIYPEEGAELEEVRRRREEIESRLEDYQQRLDEAHERLRELEKAELELVMALGGCVEKGFLPLCRVEDPTAEEVELVISDLANPGQIFPGARWLLVGGAGER